MTRELYVGLISGTSMDGFDCALVAIENHNMVLIDYISPPLDTAFRERLISVCRKEQVSLIDIGELDHLVARHFSSTVKSILERNSLKPEDITAIGSHGQTIWHQPASPERPDLIPFTLQIGDPSLISQLTGITTVADFRRRDMAAGGQAAPLVPAFHAHFFGHEDTNRIVLNIGGMSNITCLSANPDLQVTAWDTGPGNVLLDGWISRHIGKSYDENGAWAATGNISSELLASFMKEPYLALRPPKSTGRELFNMAWLDNHLDKLPFAPAAEDVQATLLEFTVLSIASAISNMLDSGEIIVCGGGSANAFMLERLALALPGFSVFTTADKGMNPEAIEAAAFAWFASKTMHREAIDLGSITGSSGALILGGIYYHH